MGSQRVGHNWLTFTHWNCHGASGCVIYLADWGSRQLDLSSLLDSLDSNQFLSCYWAILFFQKLSPAQCFVVVVVWLLVTPWTAACQASLSITISQSLLKLMSIQSVMPSIHLILCCPFLLPSIFSSIRIFSKESVLHIKRPKYWSFSFGTSLSNENSGWFPLGLTGLIFLQSKGFSRVFSNTIVWKHQFFGTQPSSWLLGKKNIA